MIRTHARRSVDRVDNPINDHQRAPFLDPPDCNGGQNSRVNRDWLVDALVAGPVGAGVLVVAARSGLGLAGLTDPVTVTALAAAVCGELRPWSGEHRELAGWLVEQARPLHALAVDATQDPATAWWTQPVDRDAQLALGAENTTQDPAFALGGSDWEVYAQHPGAYVTTSTALTPVQTDQIRSGRHAVEADGHSDWEPGYPLQQALLPIRADARIAEITIPEDWNRLTHTYPATRADGRSNANLLDSAGIDHGPGPDWAATAADLDGVHLTLSAILTGLFVPVSHDGTTTTMWSNDSELTIWLRRTWDDPVPHTSYPDHLEEPDDVQQAVHDQIVFADRPHSVQWLRSTTWLS